MPKFTAALTAEGVAGIADEGGATRVEVPTRAIERLGDRWRRSASPSATSMRWSSPISPTKKENGWRAPGA